MWQNYINTKQTQVARKQKLMDMHIFKNYIFFFQVKTVLITATIQDQLFKWNVVAKFP